MQISSFEWRAIVAYQLLKNAFSKFYERASAINSTVAPKKIGCYLYSTLAMTKTNFKNSHWILLSVNTSTGLKGFQKQGLLCI